MRLVATLCLCTLLITKLSAQTHHLSLSSGLNKVFSSQGGSPIAKWSDWEAEIGYHANLGYTYNFPNGIILSSSISWQNQRFRVQDESFVLESQGIEVQSDQLLLHYYLSNSLSVGYRWNLNRNYSIAFHGGPSFFYYFKQKSYYKGFKETVHILDFDFNSESTFYALNLNVDQSFNLIKDFNYKINLIARISYLHIFNYLNFDEPGYRYLPQFSVGLELELGRRQR